jgi:hypothetical protein
MVIASIGGGGGITPISLYESMLPVSGGGGGGGETLRWQINNAVQTAPFSGFSIPLTRTPIDPDSVTVLSEGMILHTDDYDVLTSPNRVQINFSGDPANDTENGTWSFEVRYQYQQ